MSGPFTAVSAIGQPSWSAVSASSGNFSPVTVTGTRVVDEIGYGQGGYGEDGYDALTQNIQAAATPNWTTGSSK